jgi:hypothetical protein
VCALFNADVGAEARADDSGRDVVAGLWSYGSVSVIER